MRSPGTLLLVAAASMLVPVSAHADGMDVFSVTPAGGGSAITFQLPAAPTNVTVDPFSGFQVYGVMTSIGMTNVLFFDSSNSGGLVIETPSNVPIVNAYGAQIFTGDPSSPVFTVGSFSLMDAVTDQVDGAIVTNAPTPSPAVTPEPSSLILFGTGALGLLGAARRRFVS